MSKQLSLAERMRPQNFQQIEGIGELSKSLQEQFIAQKQYRSLILSGQPGSGKSTMAKILLKAMDIPSFCFSAAHHGVKEIKTVLAQVDSCVIFIDEIHRYSKAQQDIFLQPIEAGQLILIGATTENPNFEINKALLSRCLLIFLEPLDLSSLQRILQRALSEDIILKNKQVQIEDEELLLRCANGDARRLLLLLEYLCQSGNRINITREQLNNLKFSVPYDKAGSAHHSYISAFIKSMRASDPNAALYWCARMLDGGEDPLFIARRMLIFASEDIGLANSNALLLANTTFEVVEKIGLPEARITLSHCIIYLSTSPKSNSAYQAINQALGLVKKIPASHQEVPDNLLNDPFISPNNQGADNLKYRGYLPANLYGNIFYEPGNNSREHQLRLQLHERWKGVYDY